MREHEQAHGMNGSVFACSQQGTIPGGMNQYSHGGPCPRGSQKLGAESHDIKTSV